MTDKGIRYSEVKGLFELCTLGTWLKLLLKTPIIAKSQLARTTLNVRV